MKWGIAHIPQGIYIQTTLEQKLYRSKASSSGCNVQTSVPVRRTISEWLYRR